MNRSLVTRLGFFAFGVALSGCGGRAYGVSPSGQGDASSPDVTTTSPPDAAPDVLHEVTTTDGARDASVPDAVADTTPDGALMCGTDSLLSLYVLAPSDLFADPLHPEPNIDDYLVYGELSYMGPVTEPLATHPAFDREVRFERNGTESILQYHLPDGIELPVVLGREYDVRFRRRLGFEGYAVGLIIRPLTFGVEAPPVFIGDTGSYGRAFDSDDSAMHPVLVHDLPAPNCATQPDPECGGFIYSDVLLFQITDGINVTSEVRLYQGESGILPFDYMAVNLASTRIEPTCPDHPGGQVSYIAWRDDPW